MATSPGILTPEDDAAKSDLEVQRSSHTEPEPAHERLSYSLSEREHETLDPLSLHKDFPPQSVPVPDQDPNFNIETRSEKGQLDSDGVLRKDTLFTSANKSHESAGSGKSTATKIPSHFISQELGTDNEAPTSPAQRDGWGSTFPIEWLRTDRLSFQRTRHLRNPWNHDREVKVSRDGTELEPSIGEALLAEWERLRTLSPPPPLDAV